MENPPAIGVLLRRVRDAFRNVGLETADLDARILVGEALGLDPAGLILRADDRSDSGALARLEEWTTRRLGGEPVHRILGRRSFGEHEFALSPETLEPRPDTETLVELATLAMERRRGRSILFADIGTGSGAIAVSLLDRFPESLCVGVDLSEGALRTARSNAIGAGVGSRFLPLCADHLSALGRPLDLVVSNPPYIPTAELDTLDEGVRRFDPRLALDGGIDGLDAYRCIVARAATLLGDDGDLLLEIGRGQEEDVVRLANGAGLREHARRRDLAAIVRALWFRRDIGGGIPPENG